MYTGTSSRVMAEAAAKATITIMNFFLPLMKSRLKLKGSKTPEILARGPFVSAMHYPPQTICYTLQRFITALENNLS
jgi:hypothetical protein